MFKICFVFLNAGSGQTIQVAAPVTPKKSRPLPWTVTDSPSKVRPLPWTVTDSPSKVRPVGMLSGE